MNPTEREKQENEKSKTVLKATLQDKGQSYKGRAQAFWLPLQRQKGRGWAERQRGTQAYGSICGCLGERGTAPCPPPPPSLASSGSKLCSGKFMDWESLRTTEVKEQLRGTLSRILFLKACPRCFQHSLQKNQWQSHTLLPVSLPSASGSHTSHIHSCVLPSFVQILKWFQMLRK